jgi:hypothetical protein
MKYPPFSEATPELIAQVSKQIQDNNMSIEEVKKTFGWDIGDTKEVLLSENGVVIGSMKAIILDINNTMYQGDAHKGITLIGEKK